MRFEKKIPVKDIAFLLKAEILGDDSREVSGINEINRVEKGDITFCDVEKYFHKALNSKADFILINKKMEAPEGKTLLFLEDPFTGFNKLVQYYSPFRKHRENISPSAIIHPDAYLEPNVIVGDEVVVGAGSFIRSNVVLHAGTIIGKDVIIHSGTVIGTDAFYYKNRNTHYSKLESCGRVLIADNVEIGANCTIDRGVSSDTIIGEGTKIDNQVHIGHGVIIGKHCLLAAQVGVSGKCILGDYVKLWGQVGVASRLILEDHVEVYAQSGVSQNLKAGKSYFGSPAIEASEWFSEYRALKRAPREIKALRDKL